MKSELFISNGPLPGTLDKEIYFFMHNLMEPVPSPSSIEEANQILPEVLEYGLIDNSPILNLEENLVQVYASFSYPAMITLLQIL